ncbi:hypothetical protein LTR99_000929 [Exophiala xenobiotica]|uniref:SNF2 N-terminal domain-containing protein n=1 Tax=Vermiconidia calcicola TaxID=1690605 RepID=A0AAV9QLV0_9PEZI|nr:hypothetical protein LTR92_001359 [Exophiala xenobiotica]KAK5540727.1 hypothetical protein LTR23_005958 [Chaetothyriales sp. CCFEE 6169]KAK5545492.1 hypothetical protein LTR25_000499 [Vermiconidia calcicola]KAK5271911.1 hypothetical protein LTR96_003739 [Exophiala xenobiotica]KAK5307957.1 hypothetical protein LTR99_000929 [Exophiala xenobiotica]
MANNADVHIHILATSASNISTNALAVRLYRIIKKIGQQGQYCVRAHSELKPPGGMIVDGTPTDNTTDLIDEIGIMTVWKNVTIAEKEAEREEWDYLVHTSKFAGLFHRVIADEGHKLKNCRTLKATAVDKLYCPKKWIMTATPMINRTEDYLGYLYLLWNPRWLTDLEELDGYTLPTDPFGIYDPETVKDWEKNAPEYVDNARFWVTGTASDAGRYVAQAQDTIGKRKCGAQRGDAGGKFEKTRDIEYRETDDDGEASTGCGRTNRTPRTLNVIPSLWNFTLRAGVPEDDLKPQVLGLLNVLDAAANQPALRLRVYERS